MNMHYKQQQKNKTILALFSSFIYLRSVYFVKANTNSRLKKVGQANIYKVASIVFIFV